VLEIIQAIAVRNNGNIVGMDLVEIAPAYDPTGITSILGAQLLMNSIGFIFHARANPESTE
jgi:agmatinase